jgi:MoxR-like ATPase
MSDQAPKPGPVTDDAAMEEFQQYLVSSGVYTQHPSRSAVAQRPPVPDSPFMSDPAEVDRRTEEFRTTFRRIGDEMSRMMVGQAEILEGVLVAFFAGGHVLLEGVPGLGKTMLVRTLAEAVNLTFSRVQFTPDLMPADIVGTNVIMEDEHGRKAFQFQAGPVFANILLADEINRATPKTQSALLEAMQEHHVTVGGVQHRIDQPFLVLATQNPLEMEGTYPLPEAQLDRFFFKLLVRYPSADELHTILDRTTAAETPHVTKALDTAEAALSLRAVVREVPLARDVQAHAIRLVMATHPQNKEATPLAKRYVRYGASPRGAQALILAAKIYALLDRRYHVSRADIEKAALPALRHRVILNFEGEAEGKTTDEVIAEAVAQANA